QVGELLGEAANVQGAGGLEDSSRFLKPEGRPLKVRALVRECVPALAPRVIGGIGEHQIDAGCGLRAQPGNGVPGAEGSEPGLYHCSGRNTWHAFDRTCLIRSRQDLTQSQTSSLLSVGAPLKYLARLGVAERAHRSPVRASLHLWEIPRRGVSTPHGSGDCCR